MSDDSISNIKNNDTKPSVHEVPITCFCCGLCCHYYYVLISQEEAQLIADDQKIPFDAFLEVDSEPFWFGQENYLMKKKDGFCVFLGTKDNIPGKYCRIHHIKPDVCREWKSTWFKKDCREGLTAEWSLTADLDGTLHGAEKDLKKFNTFMEALKK
jgi:Fe-S-cluster containining protein